MNEFEALERKGATSRKVSGEKQEAPHTPTWPFQSLIMLLKH
jgi:hypothetical protein